MALVLTNPEVEGLLTIPACVERIADAYRALGEGRAVIRPRTDIILPTQQPMTAYIFKSMEGAITDPGFVALRINSDRITWSRRAGGLGKDKMPVAPGGRWVGLILLFSIETGELVAILPDGVVQRLRVGATGAVAARCLARPDARTLGLLGTGWQAGATLRAIVVVLPGIERVRVWSPTAAHREAFARRAAAEGLPVQAAAGAEGSSRPTDDAERARTCPTAPERLRPGGPWRTPRRTCRA